MGDKPQYIDGVYNYCDRWCERCPLTSRCRAFAMEERLTAEDGSRRDVHDEAFWEAFYEVYEDAKESIFGEFDMVFRGIILESECGRA